MKQNRMTVEQAKDRVNQLMSEGGHCGPSTVQAIQEAWGMEDDAMLWAGTNFYGGVAGHQEGPCGAISGLGIALGFKYRDTSGDPEKARLAKEKAGQKTDEIVKQFKETYGSIICIDLVGIDFSDPEKVEKYFEEHPENKDRCPGFVRFVVEKVLELD